MRRVCEAERGREAPARSAFTQGIFRSSYLASLGGRIRKIPCVNAKHLSDAKLTNSQLARPCGARTGYGQNQLTNSQLALGRAGAS